MDGEVLGRVSDVFQASSLIASFTPHPKTLHIHNISNQTLRSYAQQSSVYPDDDDDDHLQGQLDRIHLFLLTWVFTQSISIPPK